MITDRVARVDDSREVRREWAALCLRTGAPPHLWPAWHQAWTRAFGRGDVALVTVRRDGRLVGLAPFEVRGRTWRSPTNGHTPSFRPVVTDATALAAMAHHLAHAGVSSLRLSSLTLDEASTRVLLEGLRCGLPNAYRHVHHRAPYVDLRRPWATIEEQFGRRHLKDLRRRQRKAEDRGHLRVEIRTGGPDLQRVLTRCFAVEASGWKGRQGSAIVQSPPTERFYREIAAWAAGYGWLRLALLWLDGEVIAFQFDLEHAGIQHSLKVGYAEAHRDLAPGVLLEQATLRRGVAAPGLVRAEWYGEETPAKQRWCAGAHDVLEVTAFSDDLRGAVHRRTADSVRSLDALARASLSPAVLDRARTARGALRRVASADR